MSRTTQFNVLMQPLVSLLEGIGVIIRKLDKAPSRIPQLLVGDVVISYSEACNCWVITGQNTLAGTRSAGEVFLLIARTRPTVWVVGNIAISSFMAHLNLTTPDTVTNKNFTVVIGSTRATIAFRFSNGTMFISLTDCEDTEFTPPINFNTPN